MTRPDHPAAQHAEAEKLRAEIRRFEMHLTDIANEDDCAYGKARIRWFEGLVQEHRRRLDALLAPACC